MKKTALFCVSAVLLLMMLLGCTYDDSFKTYSSKDNPLILVETYATSPMNPAPSVDIYYHKDTKVMYMAVRKSSGIGITPLLNADGTPMLWEE